MTTQRRIIAYNPPPDRPAPRKPVCGRDCHVQERKQARIAAACCACVIAFVAVVVLVWHPGGAKPLAPGGPGPDGGNGQIYPHSRAWGAAAVAGEARGAARVAGGAARWGFRGARLSRGGLLGGTGFHGYGLGGFGGGYAGSDGAFGGGFWP